ncbi:MAG: 3-hydroxyacyl-CoA dehydrogenase [bacterium]
MKRGKRGLSRRRDAVGVVGAGTMGAGIAQLAANAGHAVCLHDLDAAAIDAAVVRIERGLRGRKSEDEIAALRSRIRRCADLEQLADCRLIIEAAREDQSVKRHLLARLEQCVRADAILATNTSSLSITALGAELARPENLVGMHFFNPVPAMKLVEVVSARATAAEVAQCVFDTAADWGKKPVRARDSPGFIVNRVARSFYAEPLRLLHEGAAGVATLDALLVAVGFRMGAFELMDVIGNDVNYAVTESVFNAFHQDARFRPSPLQRELVAGGLLGRKSGRGWYDYSDARSNPPVEDAVSDYRPTAITLRGDLGVAAALPALAERAGIAVRREAGEAGVIVDGVLLALTDGRAATLRARDSGCSELVLFDLLGDYVENSRIAVAAARQASEQSLHRAVGFFNALGKTVSVLDDAPGLCVMRTVCMLANEAADTVYQGVCDAAAVDRAMRYGMNYPRGPLAWADRIGVARVQAVLRNLQRSCDAERYRRSLLLDRMADAGETFHADANTNTDEARA